MSVEWRTGGLQCDPNRANPMTEWKDITSYSRGEEREGE